MVFDNTKKIWRNKDHNKRFFVVLHYALVVLDDRISRNSLHPVLKTFLSLQSREKL